MDNKILVFILTFIGSFFTFYLLGSFVDGEDMEFIYVLFFILQFSFTTTILFQILHKLKTMEKK